MTTKRKIIYVLILVLALVALWWLFILWQYKPIVHTGARQLLKECYNGPTQSTRCLEKTNYTVCPAGYKATCFAKGGVVEEFGHSFEASGCEIVVCYEKAKDGGKACSDDDQCSNGCNLSYGILEGLCKKVEGGDGFDKYECPTNKPGVCFEGQNWNNPNYKIYKLEGRTLFYYHNRVPLY